VERTVHPSLPIRPAEGRKAERSHGLRRAKGLLGIIVCSFLLLHAGGTIAYADDNSGNNGTIKVVSATDPGNDNDNDPKVAPDFSAGERGFEPLIG
jgi:hypothetical protein